MAAHHTISSTSLPAASRSTPSRQTARHPFSFPQPFLNKLDAVTDVPHGHFWRREAGARCSAGGLGPAVPGAPWEQPAGAEPAARMGFFLSCN